MSKDRAAAEGVAGPVDLPATCYVEITTRCNLRCSFCIRPHIPRRVKHDMTLREFQSVVDNLGIGDDYQPRITLLGMGEPFMNDDLIPMLKYAKAKHPSTTLSFFTNLSVSGQESVEKMVATGVNEIVVSLESFDSAKYSEYRQGGELERVIGNLKLLDAAK
jgi:MoaA/NifB/PqqE/SkfB family radical SAM enzyme